MVDDTTLVVETIGTEGSEKVWLDEPAARRAMPCTSRNASNRVDQDRLELTVTIDDSEDVHQAVGGLTNSHEAAIADYDVVK